MANVNRLSNLCYFFAFIAEHNAPNDCTTKGIAVSFAVCPILNET